MFTIDQFDALINEEEELRRKLAHEAIERENKERQRIELEKIAAANKELFIRIENFLLDSWKEWKISYPKSKKVDSQVFTSWLKNRSFYKNLVSDGYRPRIVRGADLKRYVISFVTTPWTFTWNGQIYLEEAIKK